MSERDVHVVSTIGARRLQEAAALGHGLVQGLSDYGVLVVDTEVRILCAEGSAYDPVARDGLVGRLVTDVIPEAAWRVLEPRYTAGLAGHPQAFAYDAIRAPSHYWLRMAPVEEDGEVIGLLVISENVTEQHRSAARLVDSGRMQQSVLDVLDEGILVLGPDRVLLQANPAAVAMLGIDLEAAFADPDWWRRYRWRSVEDGYPLETDRLALSSGQSYRDVAVEGEVDGEGVLWCANFQPLRNQEGHVTGLVVSFRDVTEQTTAHRDLVDSREKLRAAYAVARLSSWEWDPVTDDVTVFQALTAHQALTGMAIPLEQLLGEMTPDGREEARKNYAALVAGDEQEAVGRSRHEDLGSEQWLETRMQAVHDAGGTLVRIRGTTQDVTEQEQAKQQAASARDFLQTTLDSLSAHIAVLDDQGRIIMTNRAWVSFAAGASADSAWLGEDYLAACDAASDEPGAAQTGAALRAIIAGEQAGYVDEYACHGPDGEAWFVIRAARFEGPGDACVVVSHEDVTDRHQAEVQVATQAALLDEVDVAVVATDNDGLVTQWNRGAEDLYGWSAEDMLGLNAVKVLSPAGANDASRDVVDVQRDGTGTSEFALQRRDGSTFAASTHGRVMVDDDGEPLGRINVTVDMTERVASERALRAAQNYMRAVADSVGEGMFTLDPEGRLNYMNAAAERLLGWSYAELEGRVFHDVAHFRRPDGTDLPITECPILRARAQGQTVRSEDDMFIRKDGRELPVAYTGSPFETDDGVHGCVVVFEDISNRKAIEDRLRGEADKLAWIERIQEALAEDRFLLYAQPIVDLDGGAVVQSELLLRLRDPGGRIIDPGEYLEIAEQYGLIGDIDRWVIERGIELAAGGRPVQINLSAQSVDDQDILHHIEACLASTGADPALVVFEITETAIVKDEDAALLFTERLHAAGCKLALDDFGTGYGGFTHLKQLPVDYLKIDIEFVRDLATNPGSRHVVEAVVGLAKGFGLQTVAEGVEDAEALQLLREIGVDFAQGYHIARPGPLEAEPTGANADVT